MGEPSVVTGPIAGRALVGAALAAIICAGALLARADQPAGVLNGQIYKIGNVQVPMPVGNWVLGEHQNMTNNMQAEIAEEALYSFAGSRFRAALFVYTPITASRTTYAGRRPAGWDTLAQCKGGDYYFVQADANYLGSDQDCIVVDHYSLWTDLANYLRRSRVELPSMFITVTFRLADRVNMETATYYLNPDIAGIPRSKNPQWQANDWNLKNIAKYPEKAGFIDVVKIWAQVWHDNMVKGYHDGLPDAFADSLPLPNDRPSERGQRSEQ